MVGAVTRNAAAISPAGRSWSQMSARISRRIGDDSAERSRCGSLTAPTVAPLAI